MQILEVAAAIVATRGRWYHCAGAFGAGVRINVNWFCLAFSVALGNLGLYETSVGISTAMAIVYGIRWVSIANEAGRTHTEKSECNKCPEQTGENDIKDNLAGESEQGDEGADEDGVDCHTKCDSRKHAEGFPDERFGYDRLEAGCGWSGTARLFGGREDWPR